MIDAAVELLARIRSFFNRSAAEEDLDAELRAHLGLATEDNIRRGMSPAEARRRALVSLGGLEQARQLHRESRGLPRLDAVLQDLRHGARTLRRDVGLTTFVTLIVGLGVGAASTVFSLADALLLRPLPFKDPARLVWISNGESANLSEQTVQVDNLQDFRAQARSFSDVAAFSPFYGAGDIWLTGAGEPERLTGVPVSGGFFRLLGVQPQLGRLFTAPECRWNAAKVAILSHTFWQRRFDSDPTIVGRAIRLDADPVMVVGVLPASFDFASMFAPGSRIDLFVPFPLSPETNRWGNTLGLVGRLAPGADLESARTEARLIGERMEAHRPQDRNHFHPKLSPLRERISGRFRYAALVLSGAVGLLMLLVCANVSNLLLARASVRQKEMAVRVALGAGRRRLIQQTLIESIMLSACGAALGVALAAGGTHVLARLQGTRIPLLNDVRLDMAALGFTLAAAVVAGILFGLVPALRVSGLAPQSALAQGNRGSTVGREQSWLRASLVVGGIAVACLLLTGAGLLMRSFIRVLAVDPGFETKDVLALRIDPDRGYSTLAEKASHFDAILDRVRGVPGVEAVGLTDALPLGHNYGWRTWPAGAKGQVYERGHHPEALVRIVDDGYLGTMGVALRAGRGFTAADDASAEPVIILNERLGRTLWPGQEALGRMVQTSGPDRRVIGVVGGVRYFGLEQDSGAEMYLPIRQVRAGDFNSVDLVVRGSLAPAELVPGVRAALRSIDPGLPLTDFRSMRELVERSVFARRSVVLLVGGFALFALILASLGLYGLISYSATQRKQEYGIRMALGASAADLQAGVLVHTGKLAAVGTTLGLAASWIAARALRSLLFGVGASDPATFATVAVILTTTALLAGYLPARRASRSNPIEALRVE
jgi:predicted permease